MYIMQADLERQVGRLRKVQEQQHPDLLNQWIR
jgi:hypothetical protein